MASTLAATVRCCACGAPLSFSQGGARLCCGLPNGSVLRRGFLIHDPNSESAPPAEMLVRDQDAHYYVSHPKFPTQVARLKKFIADRPPEKHDTKVLDLGCGPGPTTGLLLEAGHSVTAADFSIQSLALNARLCGTKADRALFVQADLRDVEFTEHAFDGLMMADFLQHLGDHGIQTRVVAKAFRALKPGGWFYLSFFNTSLANRLKGDYAGNRNGIPYWRVKPEAVRTFLPDTAIIEREYYMNVFDRPAPDRLAARLPFAGLFARMAVIEGRKAD